MMWKGFKMEIDWFDACFLLKRGRVHTCTSCGPKYAPRTSEATIMKQGIIQLLTTLSNDGLAMFLDNK